MLRVHSRYWSRHFCTKIEVDASGTHSITNVSICNRNAAYNAEGRLWARWSCPCFWSPNLEKGWQLKPNASVDACGAISWIVAIVFNEAMSPSTTAVCPNDRMCSQKRGLMSFQQQTWNPALTAPWPRAPSPAHVSTTLVTSSNFLGGWTSTWACSSMQTVGHRLKWIFPAKMVILSPTSEVTPWSRNFWPERYPWHRCPPCPVGSSTSMMATSVMREPSFDIRTDGS